MDLADGSWLLSARHRGHCIHVSISAGAQPQAWAGKHRSHGRFPPTALDPAASIPSGPLHDLSCPVSDLAPRRGTSAPANVQSGEVNGRARSSPSWSSPQWSPPTGYSASNHSCRRRGQRHERPGTLPVPRRSMLIAPSSLDDHQPGILDYGPTPPAAGPIIINPIHVWKLSP